MAGSGCRAEAGVYVIRCLATGEAYVGSSFDVAKRLREHRWALRAGRHHNRWLQEAWASHGEACFAMELVEPVEEVDALWVALRGREHDWMELLTAEGCEMFNAVSPSARQWDRRGPPRVELWRSFWA
jgi:hypothetical protein